MIATSYRYIVRRAGIRSGYPVVEGTRIGVHNVVALYRSGASVDELVQSLPKLTRAQVFECLAYYEDHPQIDPLLRGRLLTWTVRFLLGKAGGRALWRELTA